MKVVLTLVGVFALVLGVLGMFLPLLPTVPFLLLASACFARSSERLHKALLNHKVLGPYLRDFEQGKGMPFKAKLYTLALLWGSVAFSLYRLDGTGLKAMLLVVGVGVTVYLCKFVPSLPPR